MKAKTTRITALDLGSSCVRAMIADIDDDGLIEILGAASVPSQGMKGSEVNNIEEAVDAVNAAIEDAEIDGGCDSRGIVASIGGSSANAYISHGVKSVDPPHYEVSHENIDAALENAGAKQWEADEAILHALPLNFTLDGKKGIKDPLNMRGYRLEVDLMLMSASRSLARKTANTVIRAGFKPRKVLLKQVGLAESVLSTSDKEVGTLVIDIGASSINVVGVIQNKPYYLRGFDEGADRVTSDLSQFFNKSLVVAEQIKKHYGHCHADSLVDPVDVIVEAVDAWPAIKIPQEEICKIIESRMREIFLILDAAFEDDRVFDIFNHGIVLTGGGALIPGILQLAAEVFGYPVRLGIPRHIEGMPAAYRSPEYATLIGSICYEARMLQEQTMDKRRRRYPALRYGTDERLSDRLRELLGVLF